MISPLRQMSVAVVALICIGPYQLFAEDDKVKFQPIDIKSDDAKDKYFQAGSRYLGSDDMYHYILNVVSYDAYRLSKIKFTDKMMIELYALKIARDRRPVMLPVIMPPASYVKWINGSKLTRIKDIDPDNDW